MHGGRGWTLVPDESARDERLLLAFPPAVRNNRALPMTRIVAPRISVITPSYQQGAFIERTLASVWLQREEMGELVEHIVMDGGSTDGTKEILQQWTDRLDFVSAPDGGQTAAINAGIIRSRGEIIAYLNSDDVYYPGALAAVLAAFDRNPQIDVLYGDADHIDADDRLLAPYPTEEWSFRRLKQVSFLCQPAVFIRRRLMDRIGLFDEQLDNCMDYEYWLRAAMNGAHFVHLPIRLAASRLHCGTKTFRQPKAVHGEINRMLKKRLCVVPDNWLVNYAHAVLDERRIERSARLPYVAAVSMLTMCAALRWNGYPTLTLMRTVASWLLYRSATFPASALQGMVTHV